MNMSWAIIEIIKKITGDPSFERLEDANRRISFCKKFIKNKTILEFGCGNGDFLFLAKESQRELQVLNYKLIIENIYNQKN